MNGTWHSFTVKATLLSQLISAANHLIQDGRIEMKIDGKSIQAARPVSA